LLDIFQPCVSFNKTNTFAWYNKRVYELDASYDYKDKVSAMQKVMEMGDRIPIGLLYLEEKKTYHEKNMVLKQKVPLLDRKTMPDVVSRLIHSYI